MSIRPMASQLQGYLPDAVTSITKIISAPKGTTTSGESTCYMMYKRGNFTVTPLPSIIFLRDLNEGYEQERWKELWYEW
jgi:hypothetical protein